MKKSSMSKIVLATSLAALLTACGGSSGGSSVDSKADSTKSDESIGGGNGEAVNPALTSQNSDDSQQDQSSDKTAVAEDITPPNIALKGEEIITIAKGSTYIEQGADAEDEIDGKLNVTIDGDVDTNTLGTYTITYVTTDSASNETKITRTVHVTPPSDSDSSTIFLKGSNPLTIAHGSTFKDPGATATDPQEGNLSDAIRAESNINTQQVGAYNVDYSVTDSAGNKTTVRRVVKVTDQTAPVITINGSQTISKNMEPNGDRLYLDEGATAIDNVDDVIDVKTDMGNLDLNKPGTYTITYTAIDKAGNRSTAKRTVNVVDNGKPTITLKGDNPTIVPHLGNYTEAGATATDEVDGSNLNISTSGVVNTSVVGAYEITYNVTDKAGNTQTAKRVVKVTDQTKPTIKLNGEPIVTITQGNNYSDQGAVATDLVDGTLNVSKSGAVDVSTVGTYTIKYSAKDSAENEATAERKVYVVLAPDIEKPVISLVGSNPMIVSQGSTFSDPKAGVSDNRDINIPLSIDGTVDSSKVGEYTLTYKAQDRAGNIATVTRVVKVVDDGKPTITLNGESKIDINEGDTFTDAGAVARDNVDQTVTVAVSGTVDSSKPGTYTLTYNAKDGAGNEAILVIRTVVVHDITKPIVTLTGDSTVVIKQGGTYEESGATVTDNVDKNLNPTIAGTVDTNNLGTYTVTYNATDSAGNQANMVTRTIYVVDNEAPTIALTGANPMTVAYGSTFTDPGATATDTKDGDIAVSASGSVDTNHVGTYTITYTAAKDSAGNEATAVTRTVNVTDQAAPVITLKKIGTEDNFIHIINGNTFEDTGVEVADNVDTNITLNKQVTYQTDTSSNSIIVDEVDTSTDGIYTITYTARDSKGNESSIQRVVYVFFEDKQNY